MIPRPLRASTGGDGRNCAVGRRLIVRRIGVEQEHVVEVDHRIAVEDLIVPRLFCEEAPTQFGIGKPFHPLGQRQVLHGPIGGMQTEGVHGELEAQEDAGGPPAHLGPHGKAVGIGVFQAGQDVAPALRIGAGLGEAE